METMKQWKLMGLGLAVALMAPLGVMAQNADKPDESAAPAKAAGAVDSSVVLKAIPADATAFLVVRSVKELDQSIQDSVKALALPPNTIPSLLAWLKGSLKLGQEFDENGSIAFVLLNAADVKKPEELVNRGVIFIPAKDGDALAKSMKAEKEGDVLKLQLAGEPSVGAVKGKYLIVAKEAAAVKDAAQAKGGGVIKAVSADRLKAFSKQNVFGWVNFRGISKDLRGAVKEKIQEAMGGMMGPAMTMNKGNVEQIDKLLEEGKDAAFGISLDAKKGITANFYVAMRPDTEIGRQIAAMKPPTGPLLAGLPGEPVVFAMGSVQNPDTANQLRRLFDLVLSDESMGEKVDKKKVEAVRDDLIKLLTNVEQMSLSVAGLPAEGGEGMIGIVASAKVKNSEQWKSEATKLFKTMKDMAIDIAKKEGESDETIKKVADAVQWKENAAKVGDASVDELTVDMSQLPDADAETVDQIKKVVGKEGIKLRVAAVGPDRVLITFGGGPKRFETVAGLAAKGEAPLANSPDIKKIADRLPAGPRTMEGFFNVDKLLSTITDISNEVGSQFPFPISFKNAAPLAFTSVKVGDTGQQTEILVPMELVRSVVDGVRPMLGMFMGGPGGGEEEQPATPSDGGEIK